MIHLIVLAIRMTTETFTKQLLPFKNKLYRLSIRMLSDAQEAADTVQDVYLKLWNMREQLHHINNPEAMAMTMTKNLCLDKLKTKKKLATETSPVNVLSERVNPEVQYEFQETSQAIEHFINQLPEQQKWVMHLRDIEHYEFEDIETITGMNLNHIRVNLSRARKTVRERLIKLNTYEYQGN